MNCRLFESRLDELLDRRLSPDGDPQIVDHARHCQRCDLLLTEYRKLSTAIESLGSPVGMVDLPARVLAEVAPAARGDHALQPSQHVKRHRISAAPRLALAVAAALLVAIGVWGWSDWHNAAPAGALAESAVSDQHQNYGPIAMLSPDEIKTLAGAIGARQRALFEEMSDQLRPVTSPLSSAIHALGGTLRRSEAPARSS